MEEGCGFLQPKRMHAKSQTLPDLPRRLGAPRQRALRRGSRITPKKHSTTAGGTTLSLCPFPAERYTVATQHPRIRMHFVPALASSRFAHSARASRISLGIPKNPHNTHTHPRRTARQHSEAGRRGMCNKATTKALNKPPGSRIKPHPAKNPHSPENPNPTCAQTKTENKPKNAKNHLPTKPHPARHQNKPQKHPENQTPKHPETTPLYTSKNTPATLYYISPQPYISRKREDKTAGLSVSQIQT